MANRSGPQTDESDLPNIILVMSDDQGWGDVGYNGNPVVKTPHLNAMAEECLRLDRFYAAAPVCSPTRGSCLTGRHPFRYNIPYAGQGHLPHEEITLATALKTAGYATGHFGKWHVGQLSKTLKQSEFPVPADPTYYAPPWVHGFDECCSTESMMPTYNPYYHDCGPIGTEGYRFIMDKPVARGDRSGVRWQGSYWTGPGQIVDHNIPGDDSTFIMDRALDFLDRKFADHQPVFSCIWFHTPHTPIVAGNDMRELYSELSLPEQHWYGCLTAMDLQVGRLRKYLRDKGVAENTILWFCSDNGPSFVHDLNSAGPFRGKKATLWEGGVRVPGIVEWPAELKGGRVLGAPICTSDFYPTLLNAAGVEMERQPPLDGIDAMPILTGATDRRESAIGFDSPIKEPDSNNQSTDRLQATWTTDDYKLSTFDDGQTWQLYDMNKDPEEQNDVAADHPALVEEMKEALTEWRRSCARSAEGEDY